MRLRRRRSRDIAFQVLFQVDVGRVPLREALEAAREREAGADWPFIEVVCKGTAYHRAELDAVLAPLLEGWTLERLASVDRTVLRMATFELRDMDTPPGAVIDEAVELAKRYGTEDSGGFVNGVLGAVLRAVRPGTNTQAAPVE